MSDLDNISVSDVLRHVAWRTEYYDDEDEVDWRADFEGDTVTVYASDAYSGVERRWKLRFVE